MRPLSRRSAGFSLIEILIALAVLAVGLVGVFSLFAAATATHRRGVDHTTVSLLASAALSEARAALAADRDPEDVTDEKLPGFPDGYVYDIAWEEIGNDRLEYRVTITVKWQRGGEPRSETFETVLLRQKKVD